ncbi:MAG: MFS transporter [Alphaproteobacteria bacterium]|nr:MFS transporter [Alphaproteobacteria bacterium]
MTHRTRTEKGPPGSSLSVRRVLRRFVEVKPEETAVVAWGWLYIFSVLSSYYIMRPIRDQAGVAGGVKNLQWLFLGTLAAMLLLNLPFAYIVKKLPRSRFIPITYHFFAANIVLFAAALRWSDPAQSIWIERAFFIWVSVFNLFVVSVFWQLNVDLFSPEQGKRLFGLIAAGATIGAIIGSGLTASLARHVSPIFLLLGAAALLEIAVFSVGRLSRLSPRLHHQPSGNAAEVPIGGTALAGFSRAFRSNYLLNVSIFLLLFAITSTFLYFQQAGIVSRSFSDRGAQTAFFATVDLLVNVLTLGVQLFLTGRIVLMFGVALALGLLPALTIIGFGALALMPTIAAVAVFQVLRRAANYAIARPTREVLFTVVPREDRYKAKSFIDTVVYRAGDQIGAWSVAFLRWLGLGTSSVALVVIPIAALWLANALWLGRRQEQLGARQEMPSHLALWWG